jgi:hypothetical protein
MVSGWRAGCILLACEFSTERRTTMTQTAGLEIVWRNRKPTQRRQRWEQIKQDSGTAHYQLQELVSTAAGPFWIILASFELVSGGRAA